MLVAALSFVIIGIQTVRDPQLWKFLDARGKPGGDGRKIDFHVDLDDGGPLDPDEFRSRKPAETPRRSQRPEAKPDDAAMAEAPEAVTPLVPPAPNATIERSILEPVRDNTLGVRSDEVPAYFAILARARDLPPAELEAASLGPTEFRVLMLDSTSFRGRVVTVEGQVRRLVPFKPLPNDERFTQLYEAWLFSEDSGNNPFCIVFSELPEDFPRGELLEPPVHVRVTGYFFKREGYASEGGMHVAPLLLAKRLKRTASAGSLGPAPPPASLGRWILVITLSLAGLLAVTLWKFQVSDRAFQRGTLHQIRRQRESTENLQNVPAVDPMEALRALSEEHRRAEAEAGSSDSATDDLGPSSQPDDVN